MSTATKPKATKAPTSARQKRADAIEVPLATKWRRKPVVVEVSAPVAHDNLLELTMWVRRGGGRAEPLNNAVEVSTPEGGMTANLGDRIIKGVKGEYYPIKPDVFAATYEAVA